MKNMHVLLVEDNEGDILLLTELLSERSTIRKISVAKTGQDAIDFVHKIGAYRNVESPDLILLDIKGNEKTRRIPVMMLTTSSAPEDINGCYDKHANLYMTKPGDMNTFEDALNAVESFWNNLVHLPRQ